MLKLQNIHKSFQGRQVLTDVNLVVPEGATYALIGSSGSGKTTLLRITLGLLPFERGYVKINDQALSSFTPSEWAGRIGYVPQDGGLFPHLTARENIGLVAKLRGWTMEKIRMRVDDLLKLVDLDAQTIAKFPFALSGGQKQRVAIMRAAFLNPPVMLLDEPMAALDPIVRQSLQGELKMIFRRLGKTVVIVTHDLSEAVYLSEHLTLLHEGRIVQEGTYAEFVHQPAHEFVTLFCNAHRALPETVVTP